MAPRDDDRDTTVPLPRFELNSFPLRVRTFSFDVDHSPKSLVLTPAPLRDYKHFDSLGRYVRQCMRDQAGKRTSDGFMPLVLIQTMLTRDIVLDSIKNEASNIADGTTVDKIFGSNSQSSQKDTYLIVLALLALHNRISDIHKFIECGVCDQVLPLDLTGSDDDGSFKLRKANSSDELACFKQWGDDQCENFGKMQWRFLVPSFEYNKDNTIPELHLDENAILPWYGTPSESLPEAVSGGYGRVLRVSIHPLCHGYHDMLKKINLSSDAFAIKTLKRQDITAFRKEVDMLKRFNGLIHPHLVTLLGTYTQNQQLNMIFPAAERDLDRYWEYVEPTPNIDEPGLVNWVSGQCTAIMEALQVIHYPTNCLLLKDEMSGRHGDIKAENILWYKTPAHEGRGIWVISDLGLSAFNRKTSRSMIPNRSIKYTASYRPPECDIDGGTISRAFDIWTIGCFYLETTCWLLGGWDLKDEFVHKRTTPDIRGTYGSDIFFTIERDPEEREDIFAVLLKPEVAMMIRDLHANKNCTQYIHDLLDLIEHDMLVILSTERKRATSRELWDKMKDLHDKCESTPEYCLIRVPEANRYQVPIGTEARLSTKALETIRRNNMQTKLPIHQPAVARSLRKSLGPDELKNVDKLSR